MVAVDHGRVTVADLSDSADEAPPAPATPKAKAKAKAKAKSLPVTPKKATSGGIRSPKSASKPKSPAVPKMKKPAASLKRPASALSAAEDVNGDDVETQDLDDGNSAPGNREEDPNVCKKPAMRKNKKAADLGLDPITHVKHDGHDYFNMRYVAKGKVSIRNDTKKVVFTVS